MTEGSTARKDSRHRRSLRAKGVVLRIGRQLRPGMGFPGAVVVVGQGSHSAMTGGSRVGDTAAAVAAAGTRGSSALRPDRPEIKATISRLGRKRTTFGPHMHIALGRGFPPLGCSWYDRATWIRGLLRQTSVLAAVGRCCLGYTPRPRVVQRGAVSCQPDAGLPFPFDGGPESLVVPF